VAKKSTAKKSAGSKAGKAKSPKAPKKRVKKTAVKKAAKKTKGTSARSRKKVRSKLTKAELQMFRQMLLEKRRDLLGDMSGIEAEALRKDRQESSGDLSTLPTHPADVGTDNYEQEFTLGLLESERMLLDKIDAALKRIDEGTFGICLGTGKPIRKARLRARPWSRYCIEYARMLEKGLVVPEVEEDSSGPALNEQA